MDKTFKVVGEGKEQIFVIGFAGENLSGETEKVMVTHKPDIPVTPEKIDMAIKLARSRLSKSHNQLNKLTNLRPEVVE